MDDILLEFSFILKINRYALILIFVIVYNITYSKIKYLKTKFNSFLIIISSLFSYFINIILHYHKMVMLYEYSISYHFMPFLFIIIILWFILIHYSKIQNLSSQLPYVINFIHMVLISILSHQYSHSIFHPLLLLIFHFQYLPNHILSM